MKPSKTHRKTIVKSAMVLPWCFDGFTMFLLWLYDGCTVVLQWHCLWWLFIYIYNVVLRWFYYGLAYGFIGMIIWIIWDNQPPKFPSSLPGPADQLGSRGPRRWWTWTLCPSWPASCKRATTRTSWSKASGGNVAPGETCQKCDVFFLWKTDGKTWWQKVSKSNIWWFNYRKIGGLFS